MNKALLVGRLGADAEVRQTANGGTMAKFSLATSEGYRDKDTQEWKEVTDWHWIVTFSDGLAKMLQKHGKKGRLVEIEGKIKSTKWTDDVGDTRYGHEIRVDYDGSIRFLDKQTATADVEG